MKATFAHILILAGMILAVYCALSLVKGDETLPSFNVPPAACVRVFVLDNDGTDSSGSGTYVVLDTFHPCIVTANHVVKSRKTDRVRVLFPSWEVINGTITKTDSKQDLCLILLDRCPSTASPIPFTNVDVKTGESYKVFGYGGGIPQQSIGKVGTTKYERGYREILNVSCRNGDSGGSILDMKGNYAGTLWGSDDNSTMFTPAHIVAELVAKSVPVIRVVDPTPYIPYNVRKDK